MRTTNVHTTIPPELTYHISFIEIVRGPTLVPLLVNSFSSSDLRAEQTPDLYRYLATFMTLISITAVIR